jgi:TorA maturation chaperone TorD
MQWENAFDALAVGDSAHGECFIKSAAFAANHYASEYLDSFLVPFHNASVNAHAVAD